MNDSCVRFRHRANAPSDILLIKLSREYLRLLFPGLAWSSLNSTCGIRPHSGFKGYRLYAETPLSLLWMRCPRSTLVRGGPLPVSPAASPLALHCPTLSKQCFRFTLHLIPRRSRHVFRPRCLSVFSIQNLLQETRPRTTFTELRDRISLLHSYTIEIPLFGRVVLRSLQLVQFETYTPLYTLTRVRHPS